MILSLSRLQKKAATRPTEYLEDILSVAVVTDDVVVLSEADYKLFREKYSSSGIAAVPSQGCACCKKLDSE